MKERKKWRKGIKNNFHDRSGGLNSGWQIK